MATRRVEAIPQEGSRLSRRFYARPSVALAKSLVGRMLFHDSPDGLTGGRIVEVEAYGGRNDPASHAFRRMTPRNSVMFGPPGNLYVYLSYGMHHCANVVGETEGVAGAVLIRALEPLLGLDLMAHRRGVSDLGLLTKGPGRLCQAMGIRLAQNGIDLMDGPVWIDGAPRLRGQIQASARVGIGIGQDQPWRFFEAGPWVSGRVKAPR